MASITGYVQLLEVDTSWSFVKVGIGPASYDVQLLAVMMESNDTMQNVAIKSAMVDALSTALAARREVTVSYDSDSQVTYVEMNRA
jgi:hypothetical protein